MNDTAIACVTIVVCAVGFLLLATLFVDRSN